ncbi:MAG TPA: DUF4394 domain-containing protein [Solirubrobacteraceae bacterium]
MRRLPRAALLAIGLGLTSTCAFAAPAPALADDPVLALTSAAQLVRFDAGSPNAIPTPVTPSGLESGDELIAVGNTGGLVQALGSSGQIYGVDLETDAVVPVSSLLAPGALSSGVGLAFGAVVPSEVVLADGSLCYEYSGNCEAPTDDPATGQPPDVVAEALTPVTAAPSPTLFDPPVYMIDGATDGLLSRDQAPYGPDLQVDGPLGVPLAGPTALAISRDASRGFLVTGAPTQVEYSVDLATGATTPIGPVGSSAAIRSMTTIPPAAITQADPVTGIYPTPGPGAVITGLDGLPDPALEGRDKALTVPVNRIGDPTGPVSVDYATAGEDSYPAVPGVDYVPVSGTLHFAPGQQYSSFAVPLLAGPAVPSGPGYVYLGLALANAVGAIHVGLSVNAGESGSTVIVQSGHAGPSASLAPTPTPLLLAGLPGTQTISTVLAHGIGVPVTCTITCTVELTATATAAPGKTGHAGAASTTKLASRKVHFTKPGRHTVHLRLTSRGRRSVRGADRATVSLVGQARFPSGARISDRVRLTLVKRSRRAS